MHISNQKEEIDIRILRLIGLEDVFDLDYDTYLTLLKEEMVKSRMVKKSIPTEEIMLLTEEYKRVKSKKDKGRFQVKKKKISTSSFSVGQLKKNLIPSKSIKGILPPSKSPIAESLENNISAIVNSLNSIIETLKQQKKVSDDASAYDKRKAEQEKRGLSEDKLEKRFEGLKKAAEKIISPVKSLLDRILEFFTTVILGRIVYKLVEWLGNPENSNKVKSIIRFLGDWGPALLGGFILFGTRFGKGIRILTRIALSGIAKLAKAIPALLRFSKSNPRTAAAVAVGGYAATQLAQRAFSGGNEEQKAPGFSGGGVVNILKFSGGGFGNFSNGFVSGEKGVDKIPAMLSDGEFVMSRGAVEKYGVDTLESMNAAGGGTNRPKIMGGKTYAAGGGMIGNINPYDPNQMNIDDFAKWVDNRVEDILLNRRSRTYLSSKGIKNPFRSPSRSLKNQQINAKRLALPAAGESSANAMRASERAVRMVREPIPASRAIVPYTGGGLVRSGVSGGLVQNAIPQIRTNMNVPTPGGALSKNIRPKGYGGALQAAFAAMEFNDRKQEGQTTAQAGLGAAGSVLGGSVGWMTGAKAGAVIGAGIGAMFGGIGAAPGAAVGSIISGVAGGFSGASLGGKLADDVSGINAAKERMGRGGIGGAIKGGYGLKNQSFKDAPKTQIMSDDRGRPFVGYKALRNGKLTYIRGPQPGTGTSNPFEMLGRAINPGAYKDIDAANERRKYDEAAKGSISSLRARGASQVTIAKRQSQLRRPLNPPSRPPVRVVRTKADTIGNGRGGGRQVSSRTPRFSATTRGTRTRLQTLGMMR